MSEANWDNLDLKSEKFEEWLEPIAEVFDALDTTIGTIAELLQKIASLLQFGIDFITNAIKAILQLLIDTIEDVLNTGVSACYHSNLKIDPNWKTSDWMSKGTPPFRGTGLSGWCFEIAASSKDAVNPHAPRTTDDQPVAALMITKGVNIDALGELTSLLSAIQDVTSMVGPTSELKLLVKAAGDVADTEQWKKFLGMEEGRSYWRIGAPAGADRGIGGIASEYYKKQSTHWNKLLFSAGSSLSQDFGDGTLPGFLKTTARSSPTWVTVRIGDIIGDPVTDILRELQRLVDLFDPDETNPFIKLLNAIAKYLDRIAEIMGKISDLIRLIDDLLNSLLTLDFCVVPVDVANHSTGMNGAMVRALTAPNVPNYGGMGVVFGLFLSFQGANLEAWQSLETFFKFLKLDFKEVLSDYADKYEEAFSEMATDVSNAWTSTQIVNRAPVWDVSEYNFHVIEGATYAGTVLATSPNNPPSALTYSISGGSGKRHYAGSIGVTPDPDDPNVTVYTADVDIFSVDSTTGEVTFNVPPDYDRPTNNTTSTPPNLYLLTIRADDGVEYKDVIVQVRVLES